MKTHTANELQYVCSILAPDGATVVAAEVRCGVRDLSGKTREQTQLEAPETTHMILLRYLDSVALSPAGYLRVVANLSGTTTLYVVDDMLDPGAPRAEVWREVYCHAERTAN